MMEVAPRDLAQAFQRLSIAAFSCGPLKHPFGAQKMRLIGHDASDGQRAGARIGRKGIHNDFTLARSLPRSA